MAKVFDTTKSTLVDALREEGYDFVTACEHVTRWLDEFRASQMGQTTIQVGKKTYQITKPTVNHYAENPRAILQACRVAADFKREIDGEVARAICGQWHNGQTSAFYAFSSSGHYGRQALLAELSDCYTDPANIHDLPLNMLGTYLINRK